MKRINQVLLVFIIYGLCCSPLDAQVQLKNYVFGNGTVIISNGTHTISSTVGQPIIGNTQNIIHQSNFGFWQQYSQTITDVEDRWMFKVPKQYELFQNYPNPFNPTTIINYQLVKASEVELSIYNLLGQKVSTLVNKKQHAGNYEVEWNATGFSSGIYIYNLKAKGQKQNAVLTKKLVLVK